jgi:hypothetical protein
MFRRHPDLIVPIRDRRQRKRILTLKNFAIFVAICAVAFVVVSIHSELRGTTVDHQYGRLFRSEIPKPVETKPMEVVREATAVDEQTHADPTLLQPMARSQWLEDDALQTATVAPAPVTASVVTRGDGRVSIVGGTEGVTIVRSERRKPVLSGGFGRQ